MYHVYLSSVGQNGNSDYLVVDVIPSQVNKHRCLSVNVIIFKPFAPQSSDFGNGMHNALHPKGTVGKNSLRRKIFLSKTKTKNKII